MVTLAETDIKQELSEIFHRYKGEKSDLIPILQEAQDKFGYLPGEAMLGISRFLKVAGSVIYGVVTFYDQFKLVPGGKRTVRVCRGTACHVRGGARLLREVEKRLGIKQGETTDDMEYTLETVACIGACALAPTMTIDKETHGQMTTRKVAEVVGDKTKAA